ncbi:grasp-with-spasm system A modified peptide [Chryseobacterium sp. L7]|uniref:Grasp-with-spasm system A modified peptide n=1 Tax=Chryseobacterium endalhagicum TaxID=2797638 RepID=A0ABS1QLJ9_9FLAO|nr:grasp-with-spasm system A modified peptide [Chryseobacterium endalhagicum]MBL1223217.1 grasp-with-spasm system A modified peptide [Chryseobacterium endalhagicum]
MLIVCSADPPVSVQYRKKNRTAKPNARDDMAAQILIKNYSIMKKLQGMKNFSSLENKKLKNSKVIFGGGTNVRTTQETAPNGQPGNTGDTRLLNDGKPHSTITVD